MINIIIIGAAGRMGRHLISDALRDPQLNVVGAVDTTGIPQIGDDIGTLCGQPAKGIFIEDTLEAVLPRADAVIEFTVPVATMANLPLVHRHRKPYVIGTTGLDQAAQQQLKTASRDIPLLWAPNMSVGINLLASILPSVVQALDESYDTEIVETHHRFKRDAPSGTALFLAEIIERSMGEARKTSRVYGRQGESLRQPGEIGLHALRAGGNAGEHHLVFANESEEVQLVHRAFSRQTFSLGALRAVKFLVKQVPGLYDMQNVLAYEPQEGK